MSSIYNRHLLSFLSDVAKSINHECDITLREPFA